MLRSSDACGGARLFSGRHVSAFGVVLSDASNVIVPVDIIIIRSDLRPKDLHSRRARNCRLSERRRRARSTLPQSDFESCLPLSHRLGPPGAHFRIAEISERLVAAPFAHQPARQQIAQLRGGIGGRPAILRRRCGVLHGRNFRIDESFQLVDRQHPLREIGDVAPISRGNGIKLVERIDIFAARKPRQRPVSPTTRFALSESS